MIIFIVRSEILEILTNNLNGISYTGYLHFGSQGARAELVYDTGSGWLTVAGSNCTDCRQKVYNPKDSSYSSFTDSTPYSLAVS